MKPAFQIEKGISNLVGALTDPIVVFPGGWGNDLPAWLKEAITLERMIMNMRALKGAEMTGTDAEACAYLHTACLAQPIGHDWEQIYLYIAGKVYENHRTKDSGVTMPADIRVESLNDEQMSDLRRLKAWIYQARIRERQDRDRGERRERREDEAARKKKECPSLFESLV